MFAIPARMSAVAVVTALLATTAPMGAAEITSAERAKLVQLLTSSRDQVLAESEKLTDAQWSFKEGPDRWSVGEVVEHLALAEPLLFGMEQKVMTGPPATPEQKTAANGKDDMILKMVADRTKKATAPEQIRPGQFKSRAEVVAAFKEQRGKTLAYAETTKDDLRGYVADSPVMKGMDAYQWLLFLCAHTERHLAQIREVKANAGFPKSSN
jgi:DinB superfamily